MKIITWNVGEDERHDKKKLDLSSYEYIVNFINEQEADVVCLQEAITSSDNLPTMADYINENTQLKYNAIYELSDTHITPGCMIGVIICSRFEINDIKTIPLYNPMLVYGVFDGKTRYSYNKGFLMTKINGYNIITGHCLAFYAFKKSVFDYLDIFSEVDEKIANLDKEIVLCGDFNYDNVSVLFPKTMAKCRDYINEATRLNLQLDHFIISKDLKCTYSKVSDNCFDHKVGVFEIEAK